MKKLFLLLLPFVYGLVYAPSFGGGEKWQKVLDVDGLPVAKTKTV